MREANAPCFCWTRGEPGAPGPQTPALAGAGEVRESAAGVTHAARAAGQEEHGAIASLNQLAAETALSPRLLLVGG